jgi:hypothetical protein
MESYSVPEAASVPFPSDVFSEANGAASQFEESASAILAALSGCRDSLRQAQHTGMMWYNAYRRMEEKVSQVTDVNYKLSCKIRALEEWTETLQYRIYHPAECYTNDPTSGLRQTRCRAKWEQPVGPLPDGEPMPGRKPALNPRLPLTVFPKEPCTKPIDAAYPTSPPLYSNTNNAEFGRYGLISATLSDLASAALSSSAPADIKASPSSP